jgi:hypothetical protein
MNRYRSVACGWLAVSLVGAVFYAGCTDTQITTVSTDASVPETSVPEASVIDGGGAKDASPDVTAIDGGPLPLTLENYVELLGQTYSARAAACCQKFNVVLDQGRYTTAVRANGGFDRVGRGIDKSTKAQLVFDEAKAKSCLSQLSALSCAYTSEDIVKVRPDCFGAVTGAGQVGASCTDAIQCATGLYCAFGDGGAGTCAAVKATGVDCDPVTYTNDECSYRGSGKGCNNKTLKCVELLDLGQSCEPTNLIASSCKSGLCNENSSECATADELISELGCKAFAVKPDAGTDAGDGG